MLGHTNSSAAPPSTHPFSGFSFHFKRSNDAKHGPRKPDTGKVYNNELLKRTSILLTPTTVKTLALKPEKPSPYAILEAATPYKSRTSLKPSFGTLFALTIAAFLILIMMTYKTLTLT